MCTVSRHQGNYEENYIFISIANCLVNLLNISLPNHFVQQFSSLKKVKQALFNVTACCSYNIGNNNHSSLLPCKKPLSFFVVNLAGVLEFTGLLLKFLHFSWGAVFSPGFISNIRKEQVYRGARCVEFLFPTKSCWPLLTAFLVPTRTVKGD